MKSVMNGIDLVAIVPFYVELAVNVGGVGVRAVHAEARWTSPDLHPHVCR